MDLKSGRKYRWKSHTSENCYCRPEKATIYRLAITMAAINFPSPRYCFLMKMPELEKMYFCQISLYYAFYTVGDKIKQTSVLKRKLINLTPFSVRISHIVSATCMCGVSQLIYHAQSCPSIAGYYSRSRCHKLRIRLLI